MKLDENFSLEGEKNNWTLKFEKQTDEINQKTGKPKTETDTWYYPTPELALKRFVNESIKECPDVKAVLNKLEEIHQLIEGLRININK